MSDNSVQRSFFFVLLFAVTLAFLWLIQGFIQPIFWAVALGIVVYPLQTWLVRKLGGRESAAAVASVLIVVIVVILPLIGVAASVTREAAALYQRVDTGSIGIEGLYREAQARMPRAIGVLEDLGVDPAKLETQISSTAVAASQLIASRAVSLGQDAVRSTVFFFLMLYLLFFFLRDGTRLLEGLVRALPLGDARERLLFARFAEVSRATIKGTIVVGAAQGLIGGIAFAILGIGAPVLWGTVMALVSIVPAVGPALVWAPAAIVLIVNGQPIAGTILIVIGVLIIGMVDNVLRPILVGRDTRMPDYLILLSTLSGLAAFGLAGIVIGPIIAAFFVSIWQMAPEEFGPDPDAAPATEPPAQLPPTIAGNATPAPAAPPTPPAAP